MGISSIPNRDRFRRVCVCVTNQLVQSREVATNTTIRSAPTRAEWPRHQTIHTPYAAWCKHCNAARAVRCNHQRVDRRARLVPDTDEVVNVFVKISLDDMYLHERVGNYKEDKHNPSYLVALEHKHGRAWSYQTQNKGPTDEACWLPMRFIQDWDDCGFKEMRAQVETDQKPSMISLQRAIQSMRPKDAIPVNSLVGESERNGRVENAIRRVQETVRVLRHQIEYNTKSRLPETSPIMVWPVRWAAELISKYSCGRDLESPHERLHREKCVTPLVPFGEAALYLPMGTVRRDKGDVAKRFGIWLGIIARTQEVLIGTQQGKAKCNTVTRLVDDGKWDIKQILQVKGMPWEPAPGRTDRRIPVAIVERGNGIQEAVEDDNVEQEQWDEMEEEDDDTQFKGGPDKFHVSKKAIERYGPTDGCPARNIIKTRGASRGRIGVHHNDICRKRITEKMTDDQQYRQLIQKNQRRLAVTQEHNF